MSYRCLIIRAGKQGTAAYDLAKFGDAKHILFADFNLDAARGIAAGVQTL